MNNPDESTIQNWLKGELEGNELKQMEAWAEENRLQMMQSDLWGVPSFRLLDDKGEELYSCWGRDRIWLLAHEIQNALAS